MKTLRPLLVLALVATSACGGKALGSLPVDSSGGDVTPAASQSASALAGARHRKLGRLDFHLKMPRRHRGRHAHYIPLSGVSITITLNTVDGNTPPSGLALSTNSALANCASGCSVVGPYSPVGTDNFTVSIFNGPVGNPGHELATATKDFTIVAGTANTPSITLEGVPSQFELSGSMPTGTAGTAFAATALAIDVLDFQGDVITGIYSTPVTITDPDSSSLTACSGLCGSALQLGAGTAASSVVLDNSTDGGNVMISYGGMDIAPAALTGSTSAGSLSASGSATFSPTVASIAYVGAETSNLPELDLYAPLNSGTGSTLTFTDSQAGWTNSPYDQTIGESDNCNNATNAIGTYGQTSGTNGTAWTATAVASPVAGTCTATLTGGASATLAVTTTYTTSTIGINGRRRP